jgi:uncharacterized protein (TIGR00251 family)
MSDLAIRVQPRASRDEVVGEREGVVVIRVTAPPVDGRANVAVCRLVAKRLGVPAGRVRVTKGEKGRDKRIRVEGMDAAAVRAALLA